MGEGPIPWTAIEHYATRYGLDDDALDTLEYYIRRMESAAREAEEKRSRRKAAQK